MDDPVLPPNDDDAQKQSEGQGTLPDASSLVLKRAEAAIIRAKEIAEICKSLQESLDAGKPTPDGLLVQASWSTPEGVFGTPARELRDIRRTLRSSAVEVVNIKAQYGFEHLYYQKSIKIFDSLRSIYGAARARYKHLVGIVVARAQFDAQAPGKKMSVTPRTLELLDKKISTAEHPQQPLTHDAYRGLQTYVSTLLAVVSFQEARLREARALAPVQDVFETYTSEMKERRRILLSMQARLSALQPKSADGAFMIATQLASNDNAESGN
jgi:hypothetical protein